MYLTLTFLVSSLHIAIIGTATCEDFLLSILQTKLQEIIDLGSLTCYKTPNLVSVS